MIGQWILYWLPLIPIAIANGFFREYAFNKRMSALRAHQCSTFTGMALFSLYFVIVSNFWVIPSYGVALEAGAFWVLLTIVFEFVFGHYVMKQPWSSLLADYDITKGRLWVLILVWTFLGPAMVRGFSLL